MFSELKLVHLQLISLFYLIALINCQEICSGKETCGQCIQEFGCAWCIKPIDDSIHCAPENRTNWCPNGAINPKGSSQLITDKPLQPDSNSGAVQIRPQKIKLKLRKGEEYVLKFQYAQARNYPIDLYYIMDLSASMQPHKNKLASLGGKLADVMKNITSNFRLGFGSFVDKVEMPFVSTIPEKLEAPCDNCSPPYGYKNHMSLTDNYKLFSAEVHNAQVSGNLDAPEGGFDALMQAIVCKKQIGWRGGARRIIVFSTDAEFHIAGDGRLAGVVEPNDGLCHMENNSYVEGLRYDYPSISHIKYISQQNNINFIFAIVSNSAAYKMYDTLENDFANMRLGGLDESSNNVVDLVLDNYNKIVDTVTITDNSTNRIYIAYSSDCSPQRSHVCSNVHVGEQINFEAKIRPLQCISNQIFKIKPEGLEEGIIVDLETICDCSCDQPGDINFIPNSPTCENHGILQCGICSCYDGRFGKNCECDGSISSTNLDECKASPGDTELCSGVGACKCNRCECEPPITGKFCECDNRSCMKVDDQICGGKDRGECHCGKCKCFAGWTGDMCDCDNSNAGCMAPGSDQICSGHGKCVCGQCQCLVGDKEHYTGTYCQECPSCPMERCEALRPCIQCKVYQFGIYNEQECNIKCSNLTVEIVEKIEESEDMNTCRTPDKTTCTIIFAYSDSIIKAQRTKICPESVDVLALVLWVVASVVLAGIVLLAVWKLFTTIHDRREFSKFEHERANAKWQSGDNPLFKGATTTFTNPTYNS